MGAIRNLSYLCFTAAALVTMGACAEDFAANSSRPRPIGAAESPVEQNSAQGEMQRATNIGTPVVIVDLPNTKEEQPQVHTIVEAVVQRPTTRPAAVPSPTPGEPTPTIIQRPGSGVDPVNGPRQ